VVTKTRELGVAEHVIMAGLRDDIPAVMKAIDLLVLPSIVEGFGYVLVEAMAAGKPVVATNVSSIPEIVRHETTGLLVDVNNSDALAGAVVAVLADAERAREMGRRGREIALDQFTLEHMLSRTEAVFREQVARKRGRARQDVGTPTTRT
jgi:glycosyltransferase involved in cell wall biosynthesis